METMNRDSKAIKRGLVLPVIAAIALCLALLGLGMLQLAFGSRLMSTRTMSGVTARAAADAGITRALYELNHNFTMGDIPENTPMPPDVENQTLNNSNATFSYKVRAFTTELPEPYWLIESIGKLGTQQKTVYATLGVRNLFDYGLIATRALDLKAGISDLMLKPLNLVDGYDSTLGTYTEFPDTTNSYGYIRIGTPSIAPGAIELHQDTRVAGDILVGIGGDVDEVIKETPEGGSITGPWYNLPEPWYFEPITIPDCGQNLGTLNEADFTIGNTGEVTYVKYNNIIIPNSGILNILGTVYLHVIGELIIHNGAEIRVNGVPMDPLSWSSVTIYLNGNLTVNNSGLINNMTEKPQNFQLFGVGTSDQGETWRIDNSGFYYGVYYGPNAIIITANDAQFFGSIAGREFELKLGGGLHYDHDLSNMSQYDTGFGIDRLWEKSDFVIAGL